MTNPNGFSELNEKQKRVIPFLIGSPSVEEACRQAKVSKQTVYQWLKDTAFNKALEEQRDSVLKEALGRLKGVADKAVSTLAGLLDSEQENIQERSAGRILDYLLKIKEMEKLAERLEALEKTINQKGARWT